VQGLIGSSALNGRQGKVTRYDAQAKRYSIEFEDGTARLVGEQNLQPAMRRVSFATDDDSESSEDSPLRSRKSRAQGSKAVPCSKPSAAAAVAAAAAARRAATACAAEHVLRQHQRGEAGALLTMVFAAWHGLAAKRRELAVVRGAMCKSVATWIRGDSRGRVCGLAHLMLRAWALLAVATSRGRSSAQAAVSSRMRFVEGELRGMWQTCFLLWRLWASSAALGREKEARFAALARETQALQRQADAWEAACAREKRHHEDFLTGQHAVATRRLQRADLAREGLSAAWAADRRLRLALRLFCAWSTQMQRAALARATEAAQQTSQAWQAYAAEQEDQHKDLVAQQNLVAARQLQRAEGAFEGLLASWDLHGRLGLASRHFRAWAVQVRQSLAEAARSRRGDDVRQALRHQSEAWEATVAQQKRNCEDRLKELQALWARRLRRAGQALEGLLAKWDLDIRVGVALRLFHNWALKEPAGGAADRPASLQASGGALRLSPRFGGAFGSAAEGGPEEEPVLFLPVRRGDAIATLESALASRDGVSLPPPSLPLRGPGECSDDNPAVLVPLRCGDALAALEEAMEAMERGRVAGLCHSEPVSPAPRMATWPVRQQPAQDAGVTTPAACRSEAAEAIPCAGSGTPPAFGRAADVEPLEARQAPFAAVPAAVPEQVPAASLRSGPVNPGAGQVLLAEPRPVLPQVFSGSIVWGPPPPHAAAGLSPAQALPKRIAAWSEGRDLDPTRAPSRPLLLLGPPRKVS